LLSHPEYHTPVYTTKLGAFAKLELEFTRRGVKLIGLFAYTIESHGGWITDINEISDANSKFPMISDKKRQVAPLYSICLIIKTPPVWIPKKIAFIIHSVLVIDPKTTIRTILSYPASTSTNSADVLRIVDSLQAN